jgi:hypothetical protein
MVIRVEDNDAEEIKYEPKNVVIEAAPVKEAAAEEAEAVAEEAPVEEAPAAEEAEA